MTKSLTSNFLTWSPRPNIHKITGISKITISIRTAKLEYNLSAIGPLPFGQRGSFIVSVAEDIEKYNSITKDIQPFIDTLKSRGYKVSKSDLNPKSLKMGIKISIKK
jgi:hypothetical protein